jgi:uncharacterized protein (TIGR03437 family)
MKYLLTMMTRRIVVFFWSACLFAQAPNSIQTIAGTGSATYGGDGGPAKLASINVAVDVSTDRSGNLFIADQNNQRIRKIAPDGTISTVAGNGIQGFAGDGGPAINAELYNPTGVFADNLGNIYIADVGNQRIRKVDPSGTITTIAGNGAKGYGGDGGPAVNATFYNCVRVALDLAGNVVIADQSNHRVRRITSDGVINTIAGNGVGTPQNGAFSGDGGPAINASLNNPTAIAFDGTGVLYIADQFNMRIRKVGLDGTITTIAGNGSAGYAGDGGSALAASLNFPGAITVDAGGNIYFNDDQNFVTRRVSTTGTITTVAGNGKAGFSGDGGPATSASLSGNFGLVFDTSGNLYIADSQNNRIREVYAETSPGKAPGITPAGVVPIYSTSTTIQPGSWISIYGTNLAPSTMTWGGNFPTTLGGTSVKINNKPAYIFFVSSGQIDVQAPDDTQTGTVPVVVTTGGGTTTSTVTLDQFGPSLCVNGGKYVAGVIVRSDGSGSQGGGTYDFLGPADNSLGYPTKAAKAGDAIELYGVGFGPTSPTITSGRVLAPGEFGKASTPITLIINGVSVTPSFAGITEAGLFQLNFTVPAGLSSGNLSITAMVGGAQTPSGIVIPLQ